MENLDSEPPKNHKHYCGGCHTAYTDEQVKRLKFIGRADYNNDGDKLLALFNCTTKGCRHVGTFSVVLPLVQCRCGSTSPPLHGDAVHPGYTGWPVCPDCHGV